MADPNLRGGILTLQIDGRVYEAKGSFTVNFGANKREAIIGADGVHGYKEMPQVAVIEGAITDSGGLSVKDLASLRQVTGSLLLANGKLAILKDAWSAGDNNLTTEEGEIAFRLESRFAEEVLVST